MMKKITAVLLVLVLSLSMSVCAYATSSNAVFVIDEFDNLSRMELLKLNMLAANAQKECGVGIFFVYTTADELTDYNIYEIVGNMSDYFVMMENDDSWYTFMNGKGAQIDSDAEDALREVYDAEETYYGGVAAFLNAAAAYFSADQNIAVTIKAPTTVPTDVPTQAPTTVPTDVPTQAPTTVPTDIPTQVPTSVPASVPADAPTSVPTVDTAVEYLLFDEANLLSSAEEAALTEKLLQVSREFGAQIIIATVKDTDGRSVDSYVEYVYDSMDFGYGTNRDGVLLLICMNPRAYRILSNGCAADAIESGQIEAIGDAIVSDLSEGDYADAFDTFINRCEYYLNGYFNGFPFDSEKSLLIALGIGIAAGLIVVLILKGQLTSVRKQNHAAEYIKSGSMNVTVRRDTFMYRNVSRTKKETSSSSSGSGGGSRNVGGGSF